MKEVRIGLIGTGYIGKAHAIAYAQAPTVFNLRGRLVREMVAEVTPELAAARAQAFGFNRSTGDWRALVADPAIDVVDICSPNHLHKEMALEAIRHGKHVYSEKPLALNAHDARDGRRREAGRGENAGGVQLHEEPDGAAGEGDYCPRRDWRGDPLLRHPQRRLYGRPALAHSLALLQRDRRAGGAGRPRGAYRQHGPVPGREIEQVCGDLKIVVPARPAKAGSSEMIAVENEDQAHAMVRFAGGAQGVIETSRVACGRKMGLSYVITGTKGAISFTQERMAELKLYLHDDPVNRQGFRTLLVGPAHPDYAAFCMGAGHGIGFNDQKTVEVRDLVDGIAADAPMWPDFEEGWKVSRVLDAIALSHREGRWLNVNDIV
jgi:predicted dehydrogenase